MTKYVTHAKLLPELRDEFLSDITRRIHNIDLQIKHSPSARRATTLAAVRHELESLEEFWKEIDLKHAPKSKEN